MAYRCVHCSQIYEDEAPEVFGGCSNCKSKFFFYIKPEKLKEIMERKQEEINLTGDQKKLMEEEVREIVGEENEEIPVFLDFESIKVIKSGKYILDLEKLFSKSNPRVYQLEDGKYIVDLNSAKTKV